MKQPSASMLGRVVFLAFLVFLGLCSHARAEDCGVRGNEGGTDVVKLDCEAAGTRSPLMVRTSTEPRGLKLVATNAPNASKFRVRYIDTSKSPPEQIMAIGKILPGITTCEELQMIGLIPSFPSNGTHNLGADVVDCSATNSASSKYAGSLWQKGYNDFYGPNGFDGKPGGGDDNGCDASLVLTQDNLRTKGFYPISNFRGTFDGQGRTIDGLTINRTDEFWGNDGLFASMNGVAKNIRLVNVKVQGYTNIGGLAGNNGGSVINCSASGTVKATYWGAGGLVGDNLASITQSSSTCTASGPSYIGSLVGVNHGSITQSFAKGSAKGYTAGGLVGSNRGSIADSYTTSSVTGGGAASGWDIIGGLSGDMYSGGSIINCYATGQVSGTGHEAGGLVGKARDSNSSITNSFSLSSVYGNAAVGGLIGQWGYSPSDCKLKNNWRYNAPYYGVGGTTYVIGPSPQLPGNAPIISTVGQFEKAAATSNFYGNVDGTCGSGTGAKVYWTNGTVGGTAAWNFWSTTNPAGIWESVSGGLPRLKWES